MISLFGFAGSVSHMCSLGLTTPCFMGGGVSWGVLYAPFVFVHALMRVVLASVLRRATYMVHSYMLGHPVWLFSGRDCVGMEGVFNYIPPLSYLLPTIIHI